MINCANNDVPDDLLPEAPPVLDPEDGGGERPREAAHVLVPLPLLLRREVAHRRRRGHVGVQPLLVADVVVSPAVHAPHFASFLCTTLASCKNDKVADLVATLKLQGRAKKFLHV